MYNKGNILVLTSKLPSLGEGLGVGSQLPSLGEGLGGGL